MDTKDTTIVLDRSAGAFQQHLLRFDLEFNRAQLSISTALAFEPLPISSRYDDLEISSLVLKV
jgi:hypothetical protein